jgi:hypothetical protein
MAEETPPVVEVPAVATPPEPAAAPVPSPEDAEAAELGKILIASGITKDKVNDVLEAPGALAALRYAVQNNPKEFLAMLERTDPASGEKFLGAMADTFVERYGGKEAVAGKDGKPDPNANLMTEIAALREKTQRLETEQARRDNAAALAATQERYRSRVDDIFEQKDVKELGLTKAETKALRARLDSELSADPTVVQRVSKGNFVDVPTTFKRIAEEWAGDKKAQVATDKAAREKAERGAFPSFQSGPADMPEIPSATFDNWDATEDAFAKALAGAR